MLIRHFTKNMNFSAKNESRVAANISDELEIGVPLTTGETVAASGALGT